MILLAKTWKRCAEVFAFANEGWFGRESPPQPDVEVDVSEGLASGPREAKKKVEGIPLAYSLPTIHSQASFAALLIYYYWSVS